MKREGEDPAKSPTLSTQGFQRFSPNGLLGPGGLDAIEIWSRRLLHQPIPRDPYTKGNRGRLYSNVIFDPAKDWFVTANQRQEGDRIVTLYQQSPDLNPDAESGGIVRKFDALPDELIHDSTFLDLTRRLFDVAHDASCLPMVHTMVGIHVIELRASGLDKACSSPDCPHCDGEPVTAAILLRRENAVGGENMILPRAYAGVPRDSVPTKQVLARFELQERFDGYIVDDAMVAHDVSPIEAADPTKMALRTILLIDFRPMLPLLTVDLEKLGFGK